MKYFHLRYRWLDMMDDMNPAGTDGLGGVTVGIRNGHTPDTLEFAFAICSRSDNFSRKIGRAIVDGRFTSEDYRRFTFDEGMDEDHRIGTILEMVRDVAVSKIVCGKEEEVHYREALQ